jgi:carboxymethylenebutenolidase
LEVDELDRIAVGIVEIGVATGEAAVALVLVKQHLDALRLDIGECGVEVLSPEHEGVVDQRIPSAVRRRVIAGARQHEILLAAAHEYGAVVLPPEGRTYHLLVEASRPVEVGHAEREMQDARGLDRPRSGIAHAGGALERRALELGHRRPSRRHVYGPHTHDILTPSSQQRCGRGAAMSYEGLQAEVVAFKGHNGDAGEAYYARPARAGKVPGMVVIMHLPGWDEWIIEATRKFAHHGYAAIAPHLYFREGPGSPDDVGARVRAAGGVADAQVMGDVAGAIAYLRAQPNASGKVGVIGFCSGGRHAYLAACSLSGIDALADCWGGNVVVDDPKLLGAKRPVAPIDLTEKMTCPMIGIFGNDDKNPSPDHVNRTEALLKKLGKSYEFHRYDGCGHAFFNTMRISHRPEQALDGWSKVFAFLKKHLGG